MPFPSLSYHTMPETTRWTTVTSASVLLYPSPQRMLYRSAGRLLEGWMVMSNMRLEPPGSGLSPTHAQAVGCRFCGMAAMPVVLSNGSVFQSFTSVVLMLLGSVVRYLLSVE